MKKSTLLFIVGNVLVLIVPMILMLSVRFKINHGDIVDIKAEHEAESKKAILPKFDNVELNSKYGAISLIINMDTLNKISIDTGDYKYIKYKIKDNTLVVDYDFVQDSLDHPDIARQIQKNRVRGEEESIGFIRELRVHINSELKKIVGNRGRITVNLSRGALQKNDIEIAVNNSIFTLGAPSELDNNYDYDANSFSVPCDSIPYKVKVTLNNSSFDANLNYIKDLNIESRNSNINIYNMNFDHYDLKLDDNTTSTIDVSKLRKMNIQFLK
jgi:hypothetical protein